MASSMLVAAAAAASTSASSAAEVSPDGCKDEDALNSSLRSCANDPDFALICAFFQKFSKELGIELPNFKHLQEWLSNSDEVSDHLRDLHIKLLRKTRKTVHEKSWESALSKFCFTYSAQDAWEVERFGYKKSSLKVKLRILRALLESQFERNGKFRAKILTLSADSLRSQPIGRDRLGHSYWLAQDDDCNLRIYQEHLDEEIWQVVATNRDELVNLIARLRGNEVVLPSTDIGLVDEDTSSSNSYTAQAEKPPPPEEQDDSQEEARIPNLRIKLSNTMKTVDLDNAGGGEEELASEEDSKLKRKRVKTRSLQNVKSDSPNPVSEAAKPSQPVWMFVDKSSPTNEDTHVLKKARPSLLDANRAKKPSKYEKAKSEDEEEELSVEEEDIDSAAAEEDENEEKEIEEYDDDENDEVGEAIEDPPLVVHGEGAGMDCDFGNITTITEGVEEFPLSFFEAAEIESETELEFGNVIEDDVIYVVGNGQGAECLVGNSKNDGTATSTPPPTEPKATFFFGEPGCLKLSPMKPTTKAESNSDNEAEKLADERAENNTQSVSNEENREDLKKDMVEAKEKNKSEEKHLEEKEIVKKSCSNENSVTKDSESINGEKQTCTEEVMTVEVEKAIDKENFEKEPNLKSDVEKTKELSDLEGIKIEAEKRDEDSKADLELKTSQKGDQSSNNADLLSQLQETDKEEAIGSNNIESKNKSDNSDIVKDDSVAFPSEKSALQNCENKCTTEKNNQSENTIQAMPNASILNRKRRLTDILPMTQSTRQSTSESEFEVHSEQQDDGVFDDELEQLDIGGKRLKMRPKVTNTELRKKVEAQKFAIEETTSSSGEDDARRRRKVTSPRKQIVKIGKPTENCTENSDKEDKDEPKEASKQRDESLEKAVVENKLKSSVDIKSASTTTLAHTVTVKQKPTLAEIIEKKLKKTPEKPPSPNRTPVDTETPETFSPPKKSPITKPLKKNLLTQIRQEESDEETIPRKRTNSDTVVVANLENTKQPKLTEVTVTQEESKSLCAIPEAKVVERHRKRRSSEEVKESAEFEPDGKKEMKYDGGEAKIETAQKLNEDRPLEVDSAKQQAVGNRRSGRRGGAMVVYTELPQPKRTRGGTRAATRKSEADMEESCKGKLKETAATSDAGESQKAEQIAIKEEIKEQVVNDSVAEVKQEAKETLNLDAIPPIVVSNVCSNTTSTSSVTSGTGIGRGRGGRKKREVDTTNIIESTDAETPVRQSRRIAQQKIREEAERRKLEEIALRTMKQELKKKKKAEKQADPTVVEPSEHSSSEESEVELKKKTKKKCPGKDGWSSGSEEQEEPEEDDDPPHEETDPGSPLFKSDHEFSPESDLEDETQVVPMKRARTARKEDAEDDDDGDEEACQKCGKSDHPEWILLCDKCDKGYHCSCLSPVLFYIPEGDWFCPPCQQEQLIAALERQLKEFDELVELKRLQEEENKRLAAEAERAEQERLESEKMRKQQKKQKRKDKRRGDGEEGEIDSDSGETCDNESDENSEKGDESDSSNKKVKTKSRNNAYRDGGKRRRGDGRSRRRAAKRGVANRRRRRTGTESEGSSSSQKGSGNGSDSQGSSSSSSATDSDDEPIYKLRKRRQINVSYRLNEYDDLINSALKKEMDELAGAGNLGRGKDITTIIEADKEKKAREKELEKTEIEAENSKEEKSLAGVEPEGSEQKSLDDSENEDEPLKRKSKSKPQMKKKPRKLTTLDISSEEDDASDEDFKTSSFDEDEEDDTSISMSSNSDTSLEVYRRRNKGGKKQRKAARRAARERRKDRRFVVDESDEEEEKLSKLKKKREDDSDYTESETESDASENIDDLDSADLCDDTTSDESDGAWYPSRRKKQRKNTEIARKSPKLKKPQLKKAKRVEYSDDDISESEEQEDDDDDDIGGGKGSGKQPRSQPLKSSSAGKGKGKGKGKTTAAKKKKRKPSDDDESLSDSEDSTRRTRGRRYAYLEDFDDDSSDGGIKPGVKRPDTPPEEREKFIQKQEEIKRMLAEKNAEGAKLAATPRLTPLKSNADKEKRSPAKTGDSLSTVPLSVIRQAKVLDADYLQRKGESIGDLENVDDVDEFDDADLPDDFPDDMDEDTIARMVEEEEEFVVAAAARELPAPDEVLRTPSKTKSKEATSTVDTDTSIAVSNNPAIGAVEKAQLINPALAALSQMPGATTSASGLQEPIRKRLPIPTMHPPLLRHQFQPQASGISAVHIIQRHPPPTHLLQNALSAPLGQPLNRNSLLQQQRLPISVSSAHTVNVSHLNTTRPPVSAPQSLTVAASVVTMPIESDTKPRGRRKKITPLRDPLQKQQAAAAASAAATHSEKMEPSSPVGVIKSPTSTLSAAQPAEIYKSSGSSGAGTPLSVITRMPHLPTSPQSLSIGKPSGGMYSGTEVTRFYGPLQQIGQSPPSTIGPSRQQSTLQRHRGSPQVPHPGVRPTYGPPPPLRGGVATSSNHSQLPPLSTSIVSGVRASYAPGDHRALPPLGTVYGAPPPARHTSTHLNAYRPPIYGNPNCAPRAPVGGNLRGASLPPNAEYTSGVRTYSPFGYYPPPPPLTTPHQHITSVATITQQPPSPSSSTSSHSVGTPSSVIVSAPPASTTAAATSANNSVVRTAPKSSPLNAAATTSSAAISPPSTTVAVVANSKVVVDTRKKLTTLEAYPVSTAKSPLAIAGESSGSHSSPGIHPDVAEDSSSAPAPPTGEATGASGEREASEFSGLVSYFSSQHDDYNT